MNITSAQKQKIRKGTEGNQWSLSLKATAGHFSYIAMIILFYGDVSYLWMRIPNGIFSACLHSVSGWWSDYIL